MCLNADIIAGSVLASHDLAAAPSAKSSPRGEINRIRDETNVAVEEECIGPIPGVATPRCPGSRIDVSSIGTTMVIDHKIVIKESVVVTSEEPMGRFAPGRKAGRGEYERMARGSKLLEFAGRAEQFCLEHNTARVHFLRLADHPLAHCRRLSRAVAHSGKTDRRSTRDGIIYKDAIETIPGTSTPPFPA